MGSAQELTEEGGLVVMQLRRSVAMRDGIVRPGFPVSPTDGTCGHMVGCGGLGKVAAVAVRWTSRSTGGFGLAGRVGSAEIGKI
jgi:hypothetical protein